MKQFAFTLEKVLRFKRETLDLLKNELEQLRFRQREIEQSIESINNEFHSYNCTLTEKMRNGMDPRSIAVYKRYFGELNRQGKQLQEQRGKALLAVEDKQREIVQMNSDISGLERIRDKQLQEYLAKDRKEQEQFIEEFVGRADAACLTGVRAV